MCGIERRLADRQADYNVNVAIPHTDPSTYFWVRCRSSKSMLIRVLLGCVLLACVLATDTRAPIEPIDLDFAIEDDTQPRVLDAMVDVFGRAASQLVSISNLLSGPFVERAAANIPSSSPATVLAAPHTSLRHCSSTRPSWADSVRDHDTGECLPWYDPKFPPPYEQLFTTQQLSSLSENTPFGVDPRLALAYRQFIMPIIHNSHPKEVSDEQTNRFNYAASTAGAKVLAWSSAMQKAKKVLNEDEDAYMMVPAEAVKWIDIQLSEDIMIDSFQLLNRELYSAPIKEFHLLGANQYPADAHWKMLGRFEMANHRNPQLFTLPPPLQWVRFLKLRIVSVWSGNDYVYCTLTSIEVYGQTMLQNLELGTEHEQDKASEVTEADKIEPIKAESPKIEPVKSEPVVIPEPKPVAAEVIAVDLETPDQSHSDAVQTSNQTEPDTVVESTPIIVDEVVVKSSVISTETVKPSTGSAVVAYTPDFKSVNSIELSVPLTNAHYLTSLFEVCWHQVPFEIRTRALLPFEDCAFRDLYSTDLGIELPEHVLRAAGNAFALCWRSNAFKFTQFNRTQRLQTSSVPVENVSMPTDIESVAVSSSETVPLTILEEPVENGTETISSSNQTESIIDNVTETAMNSTDASLQASLPNATHVSNTDDTNSSNVEPDSKPTNQTAVNSSTDGTESNDDKKRHKGTRSTRTIDQLFHKMHSRLRRALNKQRKAKTAAADVVVKATPSFADVFPFIRSLQDVLQSTNNENDTSLVAVGGGQRKKNIFWSFVQKSTSALFNLSTQLQADFTEVYEAMKGAGSPQRGGREQNVYRQIFDRLKALERGVTVSGRYLDQVSSATIQAAASLFPIANEIDSAKSQWRQTAQALVTLDSLLVKIERRMDRELAEHRVWWQDWSARMVDPITARQSELEQHILILQLGLGVLIVVLFALIARQNCRKRPAEPQLMSPSAQPTPTELVSSPPPAISQSIDRMSPRPLQQTSISVQSRDVFHSINTAPMSQSEISDSSAQASSTSHNESLHSPTAEDFRALRQALLSSMLEHRHQNKRRTDPERNPNDTEWLKSPPNVDNGTRMAHEFDVRHENDMLHSPSAPVAPAEPVSSATKPSPMTRSASFFPSLSKLVSARRGQHSKAPSSAESAASATSTASIKSSHTASPIFSPVNISAAVATLQLSPERAGNDRSVDRNSIDTFLSPIDPANR